jgi:hypothetical protein
LNIYFNGDSYVQGAELDDPATQSFVTKLSAKLGATFINQAENGSSNSLIIRKMTEYLYECRKTNIFPDLVVIGWSESTREDWFIEGGYRSLAGTGPAFEYSDPVAFDYWHRNNKSWRYRHEMCKFYNRAIHNLHLELLQLNIPHVFFNAIDSLNKVVSELPWLANEDGGDIFKLPWQDCYFYPYDRQDMSWRGWALAHNYQEVTPGMYHFKEDCHEAWANIIYNYIKEKNIV